MTIERPNLIIVLSRLLSINLEKSIIVRIFEEHGLPLEILEVDFFNMFKNPIYSNLYYQHFLEEMVEISELNSLDIQKDLIINELGLFLKDIGLRLEELNIPRSRLVSIHLQGTDTIIFEFTRYERNFLRRRS